MARWLTRGFVSGNCPRCGRPKRYRPRGAVVVPGPRPPDGMAWSAECTGGAACSFVVRNLNRR